MISSLLRFDNAPLIAVLVVGLLLCTSPPVARAATTSLPPVAAVHTAQIPPIAQGDSIRIVELPGEQLTEEELHMLEQRESGAEQLEDYEGGMIITVLVIVLLVVLIVVLLRR
jgi:hypothetical protein